MKMLLEINCWSLATYSTIVPSQETDGTDTTRYQQWVGVDYNNTFKSEKDPTYDELKNHSEGMYILFIVYQRGSSRTRFGQR